jgi:adenosine deaminase
MPADENPAAAEYERAREIFGCSDAELASLARASVAGAFAPARLKAQISAEIDQWLASPRLPGRTVHGRVS